MVVHATCVDFETVERDPSNVFDGSNLKIELISILEEIFANLIGVRMDYILLFYHCIAEKIAPLEGQD